MKIILVVERKHLFPGLSPQGFLPPESIDLDRMNGHLFFAERRFMELNSHYKQIIPYLILHRGEGSQARVLAYQRRTQHSERRLGGLWSLGFGGHVEPLDRSDSRVAARGLVQAAAQRELEEETGLQVEGGALARIGYINSDDRDVSSVHFGVVYRVNLLDAAGSDEEIIATVSSRAEPNQARWLPVTDLKNQLGPQNGPDGGTFEDWSHIAIRGLFECRP